MNDYTIKWQELCLDGTARTKNLNIYSGETSVEVLSESSSNVS